MRTIKRSALIYLLVLVVYGSSIGFILAHGRRLEHRSASASGTGHRLANSDVRPHRSPWDGLKRNLQHPLGRLLIQLILIMVAARVIGSAFARIENMSSVFLLPFFFAYTGLRTEIGLLNGLGGWAVCLGMIGVATLGKLGGTLLAARCTGLDWNEAFALGALMNTRGLMGLVALNIGYDLGILSPRIFAMMVIMALVTTLLTGPLVSLAALWKARRSVPPPPCTPA